MTSPRGAEAMLTAREASRWLGVSRSPVDRLIREGQLPFQRVGRSRRIDVGELRAYVARQRVEWAARIKHGGRYAYEIGCRCDACRGRWNAYHRTAQKQRAAQLELVKGELQHGTISRYRNHGCRCSACYQAQADWNRARPSRAKPR
jgi:excisionase family DNA binding protein